MEENPRKKLKLGFGPVEGSNRTEDFPDKEDDGSPDKHKNTKTAGRFCQDVPLEEDEKLLDDSGIDLQFSKEGGTEKGFEIRRISAGAAPGDREGTSRCDKQDADAKNCCRGEMPETNDLDRTSEDRFSNARNGLSEDVEVNKTPDKSLFKKVQEKLMYECSLTPKKVKKKCLGLKMDL